jgi:pilus assembly protein CpaB
MKAARLVVLGVAVAAGGLAALLAGRGGEKPAPPPQKPAAQIETTDILVAKSDIGAGTPVSAQALEWKIWPTASAGPHFIRKSDRPNAIDDLSKSYARSAFVAGEPIQESRLIKAGQSGYMAAILPSGMRAVSTEIKPETGAGGFIIPGDHVDVILYRRDKEAEKASGSAEAHVSETILQNIRVLAIDQTVEDKNGQKVVVGKTATLELSPGQAETLVLAQQIGVVSLALRSVTDTATAKSASSEDTSSPRNEINMIRYGVSTTKMTK